jgi:cysteine desulfurase/selenocysteine lyase
MLLDIEKIRKDFPILNREVNGKKLVYFDNAATTQKPVQVSDRIVQYYTSENSNVHRGVHQLSQIATAEYEGARKNLARCINAGSPKEIIYTRGVTEAMNLLATIFEGEINAGDEILVSAMEHHSNLIPWQVLCNRKQAQLKIIPINDKGELDLNAFKDLLNDKIKLVSLSHISNVLGTINPVEEIAGILKKDNIPLAIDGAQALAHVEVDVARIDCDFYSGSAHKAYGPMGIGFLYGKEKWLHKLPPYQYGGEMVDQVAFTEATYNVLPYKFEAGTPNVAGALGMDAALKYLDDHNKGDIQAYEDQLLEYATDELHKINGIRIIGEAANKTAVLSFVAEDVHPYDLGTLLDQMGIAIRTGHHCAQPLIESLGLSGTLRASFALYNTFEEVDIFIKALTKGLAILR